MLHFLVTLQTLVADRADRLRDDETGATAVEYGLMVALIAGAIIIAVTALGGSISGLFTNMSTRITGATPTG